MFENQYTVAIEQAVEKAKKYTSPDSEAAVFAYRTVVQKIQKYAEHLKDNKKGWRIRDFVDTFVAYTEALASNVPLLDLLFSDCETMMDILRELPRQQYRIATLVVETLIPAKTDAERSYRGETEAQTKYTEAQHNIPLADQGISDISQYVAQYANNRKTHPSAWTARWDEIIVEALEKRTSEIQEAGRDVWYDEQEKMLQRILREEYQIEWLTSKEMDAIKEEEKALRRKEIKEIYKKCKEQTTQILEEIKQERIPQNDDEWDPVIDYAWSAILIAEYIQRKEEKAPDYQIIKFVREAWSIFKMVCKYETYTNKKVIYNGLSRMLNLIEHRPRFSLSILQLMEEIKGKDTPDWVREKINWLEYNIHCADVGRLDRIKHEERALKHDAIEWSPQWEKVIDAAEEKAERELANEPRRMGFCFSYWSTLSHILWEEHQIDWRSPQDMNPGVMFD